MNNIKMDGQSDTDMTEDYKNIMTVVPTDEPDPLFVKYSKKSSSVRKFASNNLNDSDAQARIGPVSSGLDAYNGPWTIWEVAHLLRRAGFGVIKADADRLKAMSVAQAVDDLMQISPPTFPSAAPLNWYQKVTPDTGGIQLGQTWANNIIPGSSTAENAINATYRYYSLTSWSWGIMIEDGTSIREKMVNFWFHFIPVKYIEIRGFTNGSILLNDYTNLMRNNALGNFKELIKKIAIAPAMLIYLGNQYSSANAPNENFARELLELFTLGKVPTQNYTEDDIKAAAKVLSGWRVPSLNGAYPLNGSFGPENHNKTDKVFSSFFGNKTITYKAGANGAQEFNEFFDMLFEYQGLTIAKYICRRLYRFFVYYDIDENIEANVIAPLAATFMANNWEIRPVVKQLLNSQHFYDQANRGVMIKSPIDIMAGTLRTMRVNLIVPDSDPDKFGKQYNVWGYMQRYANDYLGQGYGLVPDVAGWKAYYQNPAYYQNWIDSYTIQRRSTFLTSLVTGFKPTEANFGIQIDIINYIKQYPNSTIQDPDLLVQSLIQYLLPVDIEQSYKDELKKSNLLGGQITNDYWSKAWTDYLAAPTNATYVNVVVGRLKSLYQSILQLAEFQLM